MKTRRTLTALAAIGTLVAVGTGAAGAASSVNPVLLGKANKTTATTTITNSNGTPLALNARAGSAPLTVNSTVKVGNLNADKVDGLDGSDLQRRVTGACSAGQAIAGIKPDGTVTCATATSSDQSTSFTNVIASASRGVGVAYCPTGTYPIGGGGIPDVNGATDIPFMAMSMAHITNRQYDGWQVIFSDVNGSYRGGGYAFVTCTNTAPVAADRFAQAGQVTANQMAANAHASH